MDPAQTCPFVVPNPCFHQCAIQKCKMFSKIAASEVTIIIIKNNLLMQQWQQLWGYFFKKLPENYIWKLLFANYYYYYLHRLPTQDSSLIQDSLTDVDFNFGEKVTVNKNNYTLTYSGQGVIGSFMASMVSSAGVMLEPQGNYRLLLLKKYLFFSKNRSVI